ncbi:MAG: sulfite exporter TauE/SafE family protein [Arenimonas sp.]|nr:sulfite exporter TauE/SafE family protein [Arenimonas sp.]
MDLPPEFFYFVLIGLAAQLVDGALGMAYGITSSSLLLALGLPPALASASVHAAEVATSGVSGLSHLHFGNVDKTLVWKLAVPGVAGGIAGALLLSWVDWQWLRPLVAAYLLVLGVLLVRRAWRGVRAPVRNRGNTPLGLGAGFLDAVGGGGWGALTTTSLLARHVEPRFAIGTANAAEFFVSLAISVVFLATLGISHTHVVLGLLVGGVIAAPFAAWLAKRIPARPLMAAVGTLVALVSLYNLLKPIILSP